MHEVGCSHICKWGRRAQCSLWQLIAPTFGCSSLSPLPLTMASARSCLAGPLGTALRWVFACSYRTVAHSGLRQRHPSAARHCGSGDSSSLWHAAPRLRAPRASPRRYAVILCSAVYTGRRACGCAASERGDVVLNLVSAGINASTFRPSWDASGNYDRNSRQFLGENLFVSHHLLRPEPNVFTLLLTST